MSFFANSSALVLLAPITLLVARVIADDRTSAARLNRYPGVARLMPSRVGPVAATIGALVLLMFAVAGPRLGAPEPLEQAKPRDLMLVVDLSRSMLAEQPSRIEKAARALRSLADTLEKSGEARVGMIVFVTEAGTGVSDDERHRPSAGKRRRSARRRMPPPTVESEATFVSGTRIGAAARWRSPARGPSGGPDHPAVGRR